MYPHQADRLKEALERAGLDALVATSAENVAYLTGFRSLTEAVFHTHQYAVFTPEGTALVVPAVDVPTIVADAIDVTHVVCFGRFRGEAAEPPSAETKRILDMLATRAPSPAEALEAALDALSVRTGAVGLDETRATPETWQAIVERLGERRVVPAGHHFLAARRVKGPYELECLERALQIAEEALNALIQTLNPGVTEREAASLFEAEVLKRKATPIPALIAAAERSAIPAPWPTDRPLRRGDLVRIDVGCVFRGYHGTVGRTAVAGEPGAEQERAYQAILAALEAALAAVRPGVPAGRLCEVAIGAARAAGLPQYDRAHVGHGIGLDPYERPKLAIGIDTPLETGEVLRVETPYYALGRMGLGVKETLLVTTGGARVLNRSTRSLILLD